MGSLAEGHSLFLSPFAARHHGGNHAVTWYVKACCKLAAVAGGAPGFETLSGVDYLAAVASGATLMVQASLRWIDAQRASSIVDKPDAVAGSRLVTRPNDPGQALALSPTYMGPMLHAIGAWIPAHVWATRRAPRLHLSAGLASPLLRAGHSSWRQAASRRSLRLSPTSTRRSRTLTSPQRIFRPLLASFLSRPTCASFFPSAQEGLGGCVVSGRTWEGRRIRT